MWTDQPPGSRPFCSVCGEHRWAFAGYCLGVCAGPLHHPDYPQSMPKALKQERIDNATIGKRPTKKKHPKPPAKNRRALELQYEAQGKVAPWLEKRQNDGA